MSENLRKVISQFSSEGVDASWLIIVNNALNELNELENKAEKLYALEGSGVDNWEGYGYAIDMYIKRTKKKESEEL